MWDSRIVYTCQDCFIHESLNYAQYRQLSTFCVSSLLNIQCESLHSRYHIKKIDDVFNESKNQACGAVTLQNTTIDSEPKR